MTRQTDSKRKRTCRWLRFPQPGKGALSPDRLHRQQYSILHFLLILGFFYIWNNHRGVTMVKDLRNTEQQMTEAQWEFNDARMN